MIEIFDRVKRYYAFDREEVKQLAISILIITFIVAFNDGRSDFNLLAWSGNFINVFLIVTLSYMVHESVHRIAALQAGLVARYQMSWYGLLISLVVTFISAGKLWFFLPGTVFMQMHERLRLGKFRYGPGPYHIGVINLMGPVSNIILAMFFKILMFIPGLESNPLLQTAMTFNILYAIYTMLPLPGLDGAAVFFGGRMTYVFAYALIIVTGVMLYYQGIFVSSMVALLAAIVIWLLYYFGYERAAWPYFPE